MAMYKNFVSNINRGNNALEFIDFRLKDDKYRSDVSSQHNRYTRNEMVTILRLLDKYAPNQSLMPIRTTDLSDRPENFPEEETYARFCAEVKARIGKGTQDAMRKNLFVDFHRMGLIVRYSHPNMPNDPYAGSGVENRFASLSDQGLRLVQAETIDEQFYIFSRAVDILLGGFIATLLRLLRDPDFKLKHIEIHEFMFFASAVNSPTSFNVGFERCVDLIRSYRNLAPTQRRSVIETLRVELQPDKFPGDKTAKRHYDNWHNKAAQIYHLLDQTVYFEMRKRGREKLLFLRQGRVRSFSQKMRYFQNHRVSRTPGFELHHVVPLGWSESEEQFKLLDNWQNMVYIDGYSHAKITQNRNRNVVMTANEEDLLLSDYNDGEIYLKNKVNLLYSTDKQSVMLTYNKELLDAVD